MSKKPHVYLAGPMAGLTIEEANVWREEARVHLSGMFVIVNPCRDKDTLAGKGKLNHLGYDGHFMCDEHTIFHRDTHDVMRSDAVLANFTDAPHLSVGTIFELGLAWAYRKPIVTVLPEGNCYDHIFTRQSATTIVHDLHAGFAALESIFG